MLLSLVIVILQREPIEKFAFFETVFNENFAFFETVFFLIFNFRNFVVFKFFLFRLFGKFRHFENFYFLIFFLI